VAWSSVLFINSGALPVPPVEGGAIQTVFFTLLRGLAARGWDVGIVTYYPNHAPMHDTLTSEDLALIKWYRLQNRPFSGGVTGAVRSVASIHKILRRIPAPDYVIIFDRYLAPIVKSVFPKAHVIWHVHNVVQNRWVRSSVAKNVDLAVCISDYVRMMTNQYSRMAFPAITIPNPLDEQWFTTSKRPRLPSTVLYSGRIVPEKGLHILVEALGKLPFEIRHRLRLVIAGATHFAGSRSTSPYINSIRRDLENLDITHNWMGYVDRIALQELYDSSDIVVVPSVWAEPAALVSVEAQARGCFVIGADSGGLPEMLAPIFHEFIFPPGDAAALANSLLKVYALSFEERKRLSRTAMHYVYDKFHTNTVLSKWEQALNRL
jgi:glycosyltransferase involved in cell wall biosynthesis